MGELCSYGCWYESDVVSVPEDGNSHSWRMPAAREWIYIGRIHAPDMFLGCSMMCHFYYWLFFARAFFGLDVCVAEWVWMTKGIVVFCLGHILQLKHLDFDSDVC